MDGNLTRRLVMYPILDQFLSPFSRCTKSVNRWTDGSDRWLRACTLRAFSHSVHPLLQTIRQGPSIPNVTSHFFQLQSTFPYPDLSMANSPVFTPAVSPPIKEPIETTHSTLWKKVLKMNEFNFKENKNGDVHEHKYFLCDCEIEREKEEEWWAK